MFNYFSEVNDFFNNDYFSEEELQELKIKIIDKYKEKELINSAFTQIDLNVIKYNLRPIDEIINYKDTNTKKEIEKIVLDGKENSIINTEEGSVKGMDPRNLVKKNISQMSKLLDIDKKIILHTMLRIKSIKAVFFSGYIVPDEATAIKISNKLKNRKPEIINKKKKLRTKDVICREVLTNVRTVNRIIKQNGIQVSDSDFFTQEEYNIINPFITARRNRINKKIKRVNKRAPLFKRRKNYTSKSGDGVYGIIEKYGGIGKLIYIRSK